MGQSGLRVTSSLKLNLSKCQKGKKRSLKSQQSGISEEIFDRCCISEALFAGGMGGGRQGGHLGLKIQLYSCLALSKK